MPQPEGVNLDGVAAGVEEELEDHGDVFDADEPEDQGGERQPDGEDDGYAADHDADEDSGDAERDLGLQADQADGDDCSAQHHVGDMPDDEAAGAGEQQRGNGLEQNVVKGALADFLDHLVEAGAEGGLDDALDQVVDAQQDHCLFEAPAAELAGVGKDDRQATDGDPDVDDAAKEVADEFGAVGSFLEDGGAQEGRDDAEDAHGQAPTAEYWRMPARQTWRTIKAAAMSQANWRAKPRASSPASRRLSRTSMGKPRV